MAECKNIPSKEYSFTVIATTAKGLTYNGDRKWFKTRDDATIFAGEIFEREKNSGQGSFELAIVQCVDVVRPKPQVQMVSSWDSNIAQIEQEPKGQASSQA